jgi:hypothetical protein
MLGLKKPGQVSLTISKFGALRGIKKHLGAIGETSAGRRSPQNPSISQLALPPKTIPSCARRTRHTKFQNKFQTVPP